MYTVYVLKKRVRVRNEYEYVRLRGSVGVQKKYVSIHESMLVIIEFPIIFFGTQVSKTQVKLENKAVPDFFLT